MARIRSIHPAINEDETLVNVSDSAERLFTRLWTYLDDEGRGKDNTRLIKAAIYPLHDHKTPDVIDRDLWELVDHGLLLRYEADGVNVIAAKPKAWANYQKPKHRTDSKLPGPPENYTPPTPPPDEDRGRTPPALAPSYPETGNNLPETFHGEGEGVGEGEGGERETRDAPDRPGQLTPAPTNGRTPTARVHVLPTPANRHPNRPPTGQYPSDFEAWWSLYPRKQAKRRAFDAWKQARGQASWDELMTGLHRSIHAWQTEGISPRYVPYPEAWLRDRRWEDEPDTPLAQRAEPKAFDGIRRVIEKRAAP